MTTGAGAGACGERGARTEVGAAEDGHGHRRVDEAAHAHGGGPAGAARQSGRVDEAGEEIGEGAEEQPGREDEGDGPHGDEQRLLGRDGAQPVAQAGPLDAIEAGTIPAPQQRDRHRLEANQPDQAQTRPHSDAHRQLPPPTR